MSETNPFLELLSSHQNFYEKFEETYVNHKNDCKTGELNGLNDLKNKMEGHADDIMNAACYVHTEYEKKRLFQKELCYFLYFWIGQQLSKDPPSGDFKNNLNDICSELMTKIFNKNGCKNICDKVDQTTFDHMKSVFDFLYDHTTILALLKNGGSKVIEECDTYYQKVKAAKEAMGKHCPIGGSSNPNYCEHFWKVNGTTVQIELRNFESQLKNAQHRIESEAKTALSKTEEAVRSATTTSSISSIFGTLAGTAFPFLLYKYRPWSSWFGNHTSGNGRRGRRNTRKRRSTEQNFGSSTEDSLTEYSTEASTIGDLKEEHSTKLRSPAYTRQPKREGKARTSGRNGSPSGRPNIGYQNM
ncbi:KIR protein [Plasmodium coatneyi]|uniref:KIR protein n=1 Tax=Plasmodium coatneyi TaxID=208452 RepID=A0A1B1E1A4_9APIC|nr:KIR protein [Plasmodium coatneyi]ANQ08808.1 KIR protein [Plasmodium coatneyi]